MRKPTVEAEPNFETARGWWSDLPNIWTPVGWPEHLFRFNVLWNGAVVAQPHLNRRTETWQDQGAQVTFARLGRLAVGDDGMITQEWNDGPAPVLRTERFLDGILYRQEIFAHVPGGRAVSRGDEPLFAWIRLSIADTVRELPLEALTVFDLDIQAVHIGASMSMRNNITLRPDQAMYPRPLSLEGRSPGPVRVLEPDGRVRLGVASRHPGRACFASPCRSNTATMLTVDRIKTEKGRHVDVLLPMIPVERGAFDRELTLGYDAALRQAKRFWGRKPATRASMRTPESFIEKAAEHSVRFSRLLAETNPATGKLCKISGSLTYANLWSTPMAMDMIMLLDTLGEHDFVGRCLEIIRAEQGTVTPPGEAYGRHPGYLSSPALYKSCDWLPDNGAILYTLSMHGLLSGDEDFIRRFTETIVKSCDWIKTHRAMKGHGGHEGVLPAAVATDMGTRIQAVWSDGWNYKGLGAAVRLLERIKHPRAAEFAREALAYKADYRAALRAKCRQMPRWTDARGREHVFVPTALSGDKPSETRHAFYLDGGPLFLVFSGLLEARDPLMRGLTAWFREGPQRRFYTHDGNCWQVPALDHEMSSCEPCYSWNVFHAWQLGDRRKFLEGMYSLFAGALSRKTYISCETRGGITGNVFAAPLAVYLARLSVVDDQIEPGALHLLRLMPSAWLKPGDKAEFERLPTAYGPVTLTTRRSGDGLALDVAFTPAFRKNLISPRVVLHVPRAEGLKTVRLNGAVLRKSRGSIDITNQEGRPA